MGGGRDGVCWWGGWSNLKELIVSYLRCLSLQSRVEPGGRNGSCLGEPEIERDKALGLNTVEPGGRNGSCLGEPEIERDHDT